MANTTARFDPSIVVDTQFRVAREGSIVLDFYDSNGNPEDMYESEWEFILKKQAGAPTNILRLTTGAGNILVQGDNDERVRINITAVESNIPAYNYYYEIYRPDLKKTWFTGTCFVSNGQYNASVNQEFVSTSTDEQVVRIELSSSGSPVQVTLGVPAYNLASLGTTLQTAASDTPLDADTFSFYDAVDAILKKVTWANIKSALSLLYQTLPSVTNTSITAAIDGVYHVTASATFTDPTGVEGKGYTVFVRNGTATVGGTGYSLTGLTIKRIYYSAAWTTELILPDTTDEVTITDAATMDIAAYRSTLATSSATRTFTISWSGDFFVLTITLSATSSVLTFPMNTLCVYGGTASGNNTMTLSGVSGDVYELCGKKRGATYTVIGINCGQ